MGRINTLIRGMNSATLVDSFISAAGRVQWGALATAIAGGTLYAGLIGWFRGVLALGEAPKMLATGLSGALTGQVNRYMDALSRQTSALFGGGAINLGLFELPYSMALLLLLFSIGAWGVSVWRN